MTLSLIFGVSDRLSLLQLHGGEPDGPVVPYGLIAILASAGALETAYLTMVSIFHHCFENLCQSSDIAR